MPSIKDLGEKIKSFLKNDFWPKILNLKSKNELITVFIIILVGTASFGLGRLSLLEETKVPVKISYLGEDSLNVTSDIGTSTETGQYVASKNGTKYHFPWCAGAKSISPLNKIFFNTKEEAEKAGYTPAANCKGL